MVGACPGKYRCRRKAISSGGTSLREKRKNACLALKVADLQQAIDSRWKTVTPERQRTLAVGHGKKLDALEVVEIRQSIERKLFGLRENGQSLVAVTTQGAFP
jgi:hypothetical protein